MEVKTTKRKCRRGCSNSSNRQAVGDGMLIKKKKIREMSKKIRNNNEGGKEKGRGGNRPAFGEVRKGRTNKT